MASRSGVRSAALLLYRGGMSEEPVEVLLGHMGGPFWARKDARGWSIPKGEVDAGEDLLAAAYREFAEETGSSPPAGPVFELGDLVQPSRKIVTAFAVRGDLDPAGLRSNTFALEWPRGSGRLQEFPELDRAGWFDLPTAATKLVAGQVPFLARLTDLLSG
jgi:predicted NUDIX family NTP pyrophosphohydrolase